jgi:hypothetical protein
MKNKIEKKIDFVFKRGNEIKEVNHIKLWSFLFQFLYYFSHKMFQRGITNILWLSAWSGGVYLLTQNLYYTIGILLLIGYAEAQTAPSTIHAHYTFEEGFNVIG